MTLSYVDSSCVFMLEQDRLELFNFLCSLNKRGVFWCLSLKATYAATGFILILLIGD